VGNIELQLATGGNAVIYVPEFGASGKPFIGIVELTSSGTTCTLTESANSPVSDPGHFAYLLSIAAYAPAP
jgi:hypothetical protein